MQEGKVTTSRAKGEKTELGILTKDGLGWVIGPKLWLDMFPVGTLVWVKVMVEMRYEKAP